MYLHPIPTLEFFTTRVFESSFAEHHQTGKEDKEDKETQAPLLHLPF